MRAGWTWLTIGLAAAPGSADDDTCTTAFDGACDELQACALGTDSSDCDAACAAGWSAADAGACAHDAAVAAAGVPPPPDTGSHGTGGWTGVWSGTINARGRTVSEQLVRHFKVYVPPSYDPRTATPLIYVLGGFTVDMYGLDAYTELLRTADLNGFIVVFPQQHYYDFGPDIGWVFAWNVFRSDWVGRGWTDNPDVDFIRNLTAELKRSYNIDRTRIFASGHSRGAAMSIILAFVLTDTIAGFVSESGFAEANGFDAEMRAYTGDRLVPGALVHGTSDPDVPLAESDGIRDLLVESGWVPDEDFVYFRLENVAHEWQPQYNQQIWDFLTEHPLPLEAATP
ncbi:MAG: hypothetical protein HY907_16360 [Deltaproteobacteria bacterium]|nr:hypothetical protein [Deltaproteobacteria bacterium]